MHIILYILYTLFFFSHQHYVSFLSHGKLERLAILGTIHCILGCYCHNLEHLNTIHLF